MSHGLLHSILIALYFKMNKHLQLSDCCEGEAITMLKSVTDFFICIHSLATLCIFLTVFMGGFLCYSEDSGDSGEFMQDRNHNMLISG
jgi:hypothetical protein